MAIKLSDLIQIAEPSRFKLHLACRNQDGVSPLDEYVSDRSNWIAWNEWRGDKKGPIYECDLLPRH